MPSSQVTRSWRQTVGVSLLVLLWLACSAWARALALPDEGRYVGVAWEMLRSGNWLTPTLNGLPYFHKPPLFYWITATSMSLFGVNEWAARAASLLGASLSALGMFLFLRRWYNFKAARLTLVAVLAQPLFFVGAQFANLDMLVSGLITSSVLLFAHAALSAGVEQPHRRTLAAAYAMTAFGVLAKGLIGLVIPALVVLCWLGAQRRLHLLRCLVWLPGWGIFMLLTAPWFIAMQAQHDDFFYYFFVVQHFLRFAGGGFNNVQPIWFYPAVLLAVNLPWLPWLVRASTGRTSAEPGHNHVRLLMWIWAAVVVVFFSLPKSKLLGYLLPALVPLAFLIADGFGSVRAPTRAARWVWWAGVAVGTSLCLGTVLAFSLRPMHSSRELAKALAAQRNSTEQVFMLNHFYYDLPFYARMREPSVVVDTWSSPQLSQHDDWHREFADAARFAPERSSSTLLSSRELTDSLCAAPLSWLVGSNRAPAMYSFLKRASVAFSDDTNTLWRVDPKVPEMAAELGCAVDANAAQKSG